ncbi:MAG: hypothetical protein K2Y29_00090, partial [Beijerinckiaceae bacterium]|nr:hypothetical protein [Beijerinckiaceae bacterium]
MPADQFSFKLPSSMTFFHLANSARTKASPSIALVPRGDAPTFDSAEAAVQDYYDHPSAPNQTGDEFVTPRRVGPAAPIADGDSVIF